MITLHECHTSLLACILLKLLVQKSDFLPHVPFVAEREPVWQDRLDLVMS